MTDEPTTDATRRRLEELGSSEVPEPTPARLLAIEARVMSAVAKPVERRAFPVLLATAAAVVMLIVGVVLVTGGGDPDARLTFADGVTLERPGVAPAVATPGDDLPDGTVVVIAAGGSAVVGPDRFGPGRYLVVDGRLEPIVSAASTTSVPTRTTTSTSHTTSIRPVATSEITRPTTTTTTVPAGSETTTARTRPVTTTSTPARTDTTTATTTVTGSSNSDASRTTTASRPTTTSTAATSTTTGTAASDRNTDDVP